MTTAKRCDVCGFEVFDMDGVCDFAGADDHEEMAMVTRCAKVGYATLREVSIVLRGDLANNITSRWHVCNEHLVPEFHVTTTAR